MNSQINEILATQASNNSINDYLPLVNLPSNYCGVGNYGNFPAEQSKF